MRRRAVTLVALGSTFVLAALGAALAVWQPWRSPSSSPADTTVEGRIAFVDLSVFDREKLRSFELVSSAGTLALDNIEGKWRIVKPSKLDVLEGPLENLLYSLTNLASERLIEEKPRDLSIYGLDPPQVTVRMTLIDGSTRELYLGNLTPAADTYYLNVKGDPRVFTVREHHGTYFHYGLKDLWVGVRKPVDAGAVVSLRILKAGKPHLEIAEFSVLRQKDVEFRETDLWAVQPWSSAPKPVDAYFLTRYVQSFSDLGDERMVDAQPKDLAMYGLAHPAWELSVSDGTVTLHFSVGNEDGGYVYIQHAGDPMVYAVSSTLLTLLDVNPFQFVSKFAAIVRINSVDRLDIVSGGGRHALEIRRTTAGSEDGASWLVDGKPVDAKAFKNFYILLASMQIDSWYSSPIEEKPVATFTYTLNSGSVRTFRVSFVPYGEEFYALFKNGRSDILVNRQQLKVILQELDALVQAAGG